MDSLSKGVHLATAVSDGGSADSLPKSSGEQCGFEGMRIAGKIGVEDVYPVPVPYGCGCASPLSKSVYPATAPYGCGSAGPLL